MYCNPFVCVRIIKCYIHFFFFFLSELSQRLLTDSSFMSTKELQTSRSVVHTKNMFTVVCFTLTVEILSVPWTVTYSSFDAWHWELRWKAFSWPIWECGLGRLWAEVMAGLAGMCNGPHLFTLWQRAPTPDERVGDQMISTASLTLICAWVGRISTV